MINKIKKDMIKLKGKKVKVLVDIGRNKTEEYVGIVDSLYDNVWTIKLEERVKSFSYRDILIKTVIIKPF